MPLTTSGTVVDDCESSAAARREGRRIRITGTMTLRFIGLPAAKREANWLEPMVWGSMGLATDLGLYQAGEAESISN
jgi:hypothetical protein